MFNFDKKKYKSLNTYPDTWSVRETTLDGNEFIARVCIGLQEAIGHPDYQYQVGIAVPLNWKTESGIVSKLESTPLQEIELAIEKEIVSSNTWLVGILTGKNMREFILYTSEPKITGERLEKLKTEVKSHMIQYVIQNDPHWNTYKFIIGK